MGDRKIKIKVMIKQNEKSWSGVWEGKREREQVRKRFNCKYTSWNQSKYHMLVQTIYIKQSNRDEFNMIEVLCEIKHKTQFKHKYKMHALIKTV